MGAQQIIQNDLAGGTVATLIDGIPSLGTAAVHQNPTPAISEIASSVVSLSTISLTSALEKSESLGGPSGSMGESGVDGVANSVDDMR